MCFLTIVAHLNFTGSLLAQPRPTSEQLAFFESKIRPALSEHCYSCHSDRSPELKGGLRLDLRAGWQAGGDSGVPAIIPGDPAASVLIQSIRHVGDVQPMPPGRPKLPETVIADFERWVTMNAPDPRAGVMQDRDAELDWRQQFRDRMKWWSLQPLEKANVPAQPAAESAIDSFLQRALTTSSVTPSPPADAYALVRRLSLLLIGLPPSEALIAEFVQDRRHDAYDRLVDRMLADPRFGERWGRHWLDVVHYADTHGYEWDAPAKNAWMYRDYVVRAFNADLPIRTFLLEQLAGDLVDARIDDELNLVDSLIAPMALRLGERRHGDNADAEGISQEAMANVIDTVGKGFLGMTLACAQCHDHKLDPISQREYYSLSGMFMSTRWSPRRVDAAEPNQRIVDRLRELKSQIRSELAGVWINSRPAIVEKIRAFPKPDIRDVRFPESIVELWSRHIAKPITAEEYAQETARRREHNRISLTLIADFRTGDPSDARGWQWDGAGMQLGYAPSGDFIVAEEGEVALAQVLPAGRWSHLWSSRLAGALRSPLFEPGEGQTFSVQCAGDLHAGYTFVVDQAFHSERLKFLSQSVPHWLSQTVGQFKTLEGSLDAKERRLYFEFVTKLLNNYFPPRTGYGGVTEAVAADPRSWFGVTCIYAHAKGSPPQDELGRFAPLFERTGDMAELLAEAIIDAVKKWQRHNIDDESALLLDDALRAKLLSNELTCLPQVRTLIAEFRQTQKRLIADQVIGSMADWNEGQDEPLNIRGSYTDIGDKVPRGQLELLTAVTDGEPIIEPANWTAPERASGRLQFAQAVASDTNRLTARVFVNRMWHFAFGEGLVRTPDDFGHLGEPPSHPQLLDYLTDRFIQEGWSIKKLMRTLVTSAAWRRSSIAFPQSIAVDPENRLWHYFPPRRLEAEAIRDAMLLLSGSLDSTVGGPPVDPFRTAQDSAKRLFSGPLDGNGRRSLYIKMTLMEPPRFLALFNQPIPKQTVGRRDVTSVPDQSLALLNDPFVLAMAHNWSSRLIAQTETSVAERLQRMFLAALTRPPTPSDMDRLTHFLYASARVRGIADASVAQSAVVWQDVAHALFNLKEFIHVR